MNTRRFLFLVLCFLAPLASNAQITGFFDDFSNGSLDTLWQDNSVTLWTTNSTNTFGLSEGSGVFTIDYSRNAQSTSTDYVRFAAPEAVNVSENPKIRFSIRSTVTSTMLARAVFGSRGGANQDFTIELIGNNEWQTISLDLDPTLFGSFNFNYLFFYFDQNSTSLRSGDIELDDLKIAGFTIKIPSFDAQTINGTNVVLSWNSSDSAGTKLYKVYRSSDPDFSPTQANLVTGTTKNTFTNQGLDAYQTYFYKVVPVDTLDEEFEASSAVMAQTYENGVLPEVTVTQVSATEVPKYEEFALDLTLSNVAIYNPYDPTDIDVYARFTSPEGKTLRINAFYDNYNNADQWRLYFSPDQLGTWNYKLFINDIGGSDSTVTATFTSVASEHHGPLLVSDLNPDYLIYNDGTPFYGLSVYYPWNVQEYKLDQLQEHGLNMIGYWNGTYDGSGNGGGGYLFESTRSGLGRYDQQKMGRIEQILDWLEARDMMLMYSIWAHPFLRDGEPGWDPIHYEYNPYKDIVDAEEFYTDSLAWEYQLKNYRYLIARFAHHRSMGIWEIVNEMHGTTGFVKDQEGALAWINKVDAYLKEHDPYQRPTTASVGSVELWSQVDINADIANRHYYEGQGYPQPFSDAIHDGLFNVVDAYQGLKKSGNRPAMLGEAGATHMFSSAGSVGYDTEFHNALWAGLATGMTSTPFWWDYTTTSIFTEDVMDTYLHIGAFVEELSLSTIHFSPVATETEDEYIYTMQNDTSAFGWLWKISSDFVAGTTFSVDGLQTGTYELEWFNTWTGTVERRDTAVSVDGILPLTVFDMPTPERDIAFKLHKIENGETATSLNILFPNNNVTTGEIPLAYPLYAYITDESGRLVDAETQVTFTITGNGRVLEQTVTTENGVAKNTYISDNSGPSFFSVTVEAIGLTAASLNDVAVTDNEAETDDIPSDFVLNQNYPNPFNPSTVISYQLPINSTVKLSVYDISGREISTLVDGVQSAGTYELSFDASGVASGVYLYRLTTDAFTQTKRMLLLK